MHGLNDDSTSLLLTTGLNSSVHVYCFNFKCMIGCLVIQFEKNGGLLADGAADQPDKP